MTSGGGFPEQRVATEGCERGTSLARKQLCTEHANAGLNKLPKALSVFPHMFCLVGLLRETTELI